MLPGIVYAAPTFYYMDVAYCEQQIREQWNIVLDKEPESVTFPWSCHIAEQWWAEARPWWMGLS
jgi:hypothetical protein